MKSKLKPRPPPTNNPEKCQDIRTNLSQKTETKRRAHLKKSMNILLDMKKTALLLTIIRGQLSLRSKPRLSVKLTPPMKRCTITADGQEHRPLELKSTHCHQNCQNLFQHHGPVHCTIRVTNQQIKGCRTGFMAPAPPSSALDARPALAKKLENKSKRISLATPAQPGFCHQISSNTQTTPTQQNTRWQHLNKPTQHRTSM